MLFTILDIETTGFNNKHDDILEVGYLIVNQDCEILRHGQFYFYQEHFKIEGSAQDVHGLTRDFLKQYEQDFTKSLARLFTLCCQAIIIGKNNRKFDMPFIDEFLKRYAYRLDEVTIKGYIDLEEFYTPIYREWYVKKYGVATKKYGTLSELVDIIGYPQQQLQQEFNFLFPDISRDRAHSALFDSYMTYTLLKDAVKNHGLELVRKRK